MSEIDVEVLKSTIYDWIKDLALPGVADDSIVFQFQNVVLPAKPCISLRISSMLQIGDAYTAKATNGNSDERNIISTWDFVLEILGFGKGIFNNTIKIKKSLNDPIVHAALKAGEVISWNNTEAVQDISGLDDKENEERSSYDAFMRTCDEIENVPVGQISIFNGVGTFKHPGKPDYIQNINIDSTV